MSKVGKMMQKKGRSETKACPECGKKATTAHVVTCKDQEALQTLGDFMEKLDKWMVRSE